MLVVLYLQTTLFAWCSSPYMLLTPFFTSVCREWGPMAWVNPWASQTSCPYAWLQAPHAASTKVPSFTASHGAWSSSPLSVNPRTFSIMVMSNIFCHPLPLVLFLFPFFLGHKEAQDQLPQYTREFGKLLPALSEEAVGEEGKVGRARQRCEGWENLEAGSTVWAGMTLR